MGLNDLGLGNSDGMHRQCPGPKGCDLCPNCRGCRNVPSWMMGACTCMGHGGNAKRITPLGGPPMSPNALEEPRQPEPFPGVTKKDRELVDVGS